MAKHPAYLFYPSDFKQGTKYFNFYQRAIYRELLDAQWDDGFIPNNVDLLANMIGMDRDDFMMNWAVVKTKFKELEEGKLINPRLEEEREKLLKKSQKASESAKKRWKKSESNSNEKQTKSKRNAKAMRTHSDSNAIIDNEIDNEIEIDNEKEEKGGVGEKTKINFNEVKEFYNSIAAECEMPLIREMTDSRKSAFRRLSKKYEYEIIGEVFHKARDSDFLNGSKDFKASFDWLMNPKNFVKVLEDNYKNKSLNGNSTRQSDQSIRREINSSVDEIYAGRK